MHVQHNLVYKNSSLNPSATEHKHTHAYK